MTDSTDVFDRQTVGGPGQGRGGNRPPASNLFVLAAAGLISVIVLIILVLLIFGDDDVSVDTTDTSTTTTTVDSTTTETTASTSTESIASSVATTSTVVSTTSSSATTTSTAQTTTSTVGDLEAFRSAVWPWPDSALRYSDPVAAAEGFAVDLVGFTDPIVGAFEQGDTRSGEVSIRPAADGPITTVFVRALGTDDTWWVLGSATQNITITEPTAMSTIESPQTLTGTALAFEGHVDVVLRADGIAQPLVETFVTGGGDEPQRFEGSLDWTDRGTVGGALVLTTSGGEDGRIWEAAVTRILFDDS